MVWVAGFWVIGWVLTIMAIGPLQKPSLPRQIWLASEMFFIWPYLVWKLANERN